jgi:hypothetical protein
MEIKELSAFQIAVILFIVLVIAGIINMNIPHPDFEASKFEHVEAPLHKNTEFNLKKGEYYVYDLSYENATGGITFIVEGGAYCTFLSANSGLENAKRACVDRYGNDESGSNVSLLEPTIFFFKPWMLAVDENWKWNTTIYAVANDTRAHVMDVRYSTIRTDIINGRKTYVVKIEMGDNQVFYDWIDDEKRILVKEVGGGMTVELVEGFGEEPLNISECY